VKDGVLLPVYENFNFHRLEVNWTEYFEIFKDHTLTAQFRAGTIFGPPVPDFFDFYLGGLIGMKSYPFYSISGNELGWLNLTYRMPIFKHIDGRLGLWYFDKLYFSVYGDYGNAWTEGSPRIKDFKKGAGAELRLKMISFYIFPTSLFFNASYSFDKVERKNLGSLAVYGKEWRFYGGILFDFNF
jgi:outer membrane protein assembly factor BamA